MLLTLSLPLAVLWEEAGQSSGQSSLLQPVRVGSVSDATTIATGKETKTQPQGQDYHRLPQSLYPTYEDHSIPPAQLLLNHTTFV